ncbi:MAG: trigger factor [Deltaproteobacteria bacterium]|nr:trigger factor [Deltaproteobacteria bacterium]MCL5792311.1 trigger factor [Deltaproteobacteria bacterium]
MKIVNVETVSDVRKRISVVIPKDMTADMIKKEFDKFSKKASIPGFRKGKIPKEIIEERFKKDIEYETGIELIEHTINDALRESNIKAVGSPEVEKMNFEPDGDFSYIVVIENIPEITNIDFKAIELKKLSEPEVTDEQMNAALSDLHKKYGVLTPIEEVRPLRDKDFASVKLIVSDEKGRVKKVYDDLQWALDERLDKTIYEQMPGMLVGEKRKVINKAKKEIYSIELKTIKYIKYPPIDDEFAKAVGKYNSLEELREDIRKRIEYDIKTFNKVIYRNLIGEALLKKYPVNLPQSIVNEKLKEIASKDSELQKSYQTGDVKAIEERFKDLEKFVRNAFAINVLFEAIESQENIVVSEEELKTAIENVATQNNDTAENITEKLKKDNSMDSLRHQIIDDKILELVLQHAQFKA